MKAQDKQTVYNLLKAVSGNINGYTTAAFKQNPVFCDDEIASEGEETQSLAPEAQSNVQTQSTVPEAQPAVQTQSPTPEAKSPVQTQSPTPEAHSTGITLDSINEKIARCTKCQLARTRNNVVPGTGVLTPDVLVIGEGPGYDEDMQGLPFVGKAGALLDKMLAAIDLDRKTNCYIANIVKCRPPQNRNPEPEEQSSCFPYLEAQIHILKPKMILCMGKIAGQKLLNIEDTITNMRYKFHEYNNIPVLVTYHPSALLRNADLKRPAWEDLKLFRKKLDEILAQQ